MEESRKQSPPLVIERLHAWLEEKIGDVAEDDWLSLDDFEMYCDSVLREWSMLSRISVANPEVKKALAVRCEENLVGAKAAPAKMVTAWLQRK